MSPSQHPSSPLGLLGKLAVVSLLLVSGVEALTAAEWRSRSIYQVRLVLLGCGAWRVVRRADGGGRTLSRCPLGQRKAGRRPVWSWAVIPVHPGSLLLLALLVGVQTPGADGQTPVLPLTLPVRRQVMTDRFATANGTNPRCVTTDLVYCGGSWGGIGACSLLAAL